MPAAPQVIPNTITKPRHTSRIFPKSIVSSSEVSEARKKLAPVRNMGAAYAVALFAFKEEENCSAFQPNTYISVTKRTFSKVES
jgi:hypothetical protein